MVIEEQLKTLIETRDILKNYEEFQIFTHNKNTGEDGVATFYLDNKTIKVFEGKEDGSEDKEMDYKTFLENYDYHMSHEFEPDVELKVKL